MINQFLLVGIFILLTFSDFFLSIIMVYSYEKRGIYTSAGIICKGHTDMEHHVNEDPGTPHVGKYRIQKLGR